MLPWSTAGGKRSIKLKNCFFVEDAGAARVDADAGAAGVDAGAGEEEAETGAGTAGVATVEEGAGGAVADAVVVDDLPRRDAAAE